VTRHVEGAPTREILPSQVLANVRTCERKLASLERVGVERDAFRAVTVASQVKWIAPSRWSRDHHSALRLSPPLCPSKLDPFRHFSIVTPQPTSRVGRPGGGPCERDWRNRRRYGRAGQPSPQPERPRPELELGQGVRKCWPVERLGREPGILEHSHELQPTTTALGCDRGTLGSKPGT